MPARSFHRIEVNRSLPIRDALLHAKGAGRIVSNAFLDDRTRYLDEDLHRDRPVTVELEFRRLDAPLSATDAVLSGLENEGVRAADLQETLALLRRRPEFFHELANFPLQILGERIRAPQLSPKLCIPVFPDDGGTPPPALWLVERSNFIGGIVVLVARKA